MNQYARPLPEPDRPALDGAPAPVPEPGGTPTPPAALPATAVQTKAARLARTLHGWLVFVVAANLVWFFAREATLANQAFSALVAGTVFLAAFRLERRSVSFARLSRLAQGVYRARAVALGVFALASVGYFVPLALEPATVILAGVTLLVVSTIWSAVTKGLLGARPVSRVLIVGAGDNALRFSRDFASDPHPEYHVVGLLADGDDERARAEAARSAPATSDALTRIDDFAAPVIGTLDELERVIADEAIDTVAVAVKRERLALFSRLAAIDNGSITVQELTALSEHVFGRVPVEAVNAAWFMHLIHPFYRPYSRVTKRLADMLCSALIALAAAPLFPIVALLVKLTSRGPVLYSQVRVGEGGREFRMYKFRSMAADAEKAGAVWAQKNDPRVTPVGRFIRATRLDELPQLWNILVGHMSFVGPRPERPEFVADLERTIPYYQRRHMVKPGLTGWAQVRFGYSDSVDGAADKLGYELYYLKHQSLLLDVVIFVETIRVVLLRFGSR